MKSFLKLFLFVFAIFAILIFSGCGNSDILVPETETPSESTAEETTVSGEADNDDSDCEHQYTEKILVAASCQKEGVTKKTCSLCGKAQSITVPKAAHIEVIDSAVPATCTALGKTEGKHCSVCNTVLVAQEPTAALGHNEVIDKAIPATCTTPGKTEGKHCSRCNTVLVAQEPTAALGHNEVIDEAIPATCTTPGKTEGKHCSVCNTVLVAQEPTAALGHNEVIDEAIPATCTTPGKTEGKHCSRCNTVIKAQETVSAHTIIKRTCHPVTCERSGSLENYCIECEKVLSYETVPAGHYPEGHAYSNYNGLCTEFKHGDRCAVCENYFIAPGTYTIIKSDSWFARADFKFEYYTVSGDKQTANRINQHLAGNDHATLEFDGYTARAYNELKYTYEDYYSGCITITEEDFAVVNENFYNAFSRYFEKGEYTLSGTYEFQKNIWVSSLNSYINNIGEPTNISFSYFGTDGTKFTSTSISVTGNVNDKILINYGNFVGVYMNYYYNERTEWSKYIERRVIFETPQKVSKEFFEWFTSIATKVIT